MKKKTSYRIRNWPAYNAALIERGSLTLWVDEEAQRGWRYTDPTQRGAQSHYADTALSCGLTLRAVYQRVRLCANLLGFDLVRKSTAFVGWVATHPTLLMSAETVAADHVITRNKKDFQSAQLPILTPEEWLALESVAGLEADQQTEGGSRPIPPSFTEVGAQPILEFFDSHSSAYPTALCITSS